MKNFVFRETFPKGCFSGKSYLKKNLFKILLLFITFQRIFTTPLCREMMKATRHETGGGSEVRYCGPYSWTVCVLAMFPWICFCPLDKRAVSP